MEKNLDGKEEIKEKKCYFENNFNKPKETNQVFLRKNKKVYTEKKTYINLWCLKIFH